MKYETHTLIKGSSATLTTYLHENSVEILTKTRPFILVIPGGGYEMVSEREAEPVVNEFYRLGYHAGVLRYSVGEKAGNMQPLKEGITAMKMIRDHAKAWHVSEVAVMGFSAGGHLAACIGTMYNEPKLVSALGFDTAKCRPDALVLSYAVLSSAAHTYDGFFASFTGTEDENEHRFYSPELRVNQDTPPTFIWQTVDDDIVPVENALLFISALQSNQVSYEAHLFRGAVHGISVCNEQTDYVDDHCGQWIDLCGEWLNEVLR
ncbi:MAG: alpha/beta hydrolase [Lachnospiraceae bacterium]|jgi:acetyl esterase/lipase|nr:alpha/beta hydrolase [Lachnospiraceae bacterium]